MVNEDQRASCRGERFDERGDVAVGARVVARTPPRVVKRDLRVDNDQGGVVVDDTGSGEHIGDVSHRSSFVAGGQGQGASSSPSPQR
jgi:hypothetical protein